MSKQNMSINGHNWCAGDADLDRALQLLRSNSKHGEDAAAERSACSPIPNYPTYLS